MGLFEKAGREVERFKRQAESAVGEMTDDGENDEPAEDDELGGDDSSGEGDEPGTERADPDDDADGPA
ncbi:hypothetical protein [Halalkalicoccus tibetensis]|uniref:Uncharacterized protein n=1 Tax=Halalkalicoccus tibetensis TaxID=175632 RepID=A0ABD5V462_9EURY